MQRILQQRLKLVNAAQIKIFYKLETTLKSGISCCIIAVKIFNQFTRGKL